MKKKILFSTLIAFSIGLIFSFSCVLATNTNPVDGIRNFVGGAENVMEGAAAGITNGIRNTTGAITNGMNNTFGTNNTMANNTAVTGAITTDNNTTGYTATRTATAFDEPTLMGINMTTWTWIIMALAAIGIVTLIWAYTRQQSEKNYNSYDK